MNDITHFILTHFGVDIVILLLILSLFALIFLVACWEKHPIRQYVPGPPEDACPPSGYFRAMNEAAIRHGLWHGGDYLQKRESSLYKCCISLWLTPDRNTLVMVWGGKMARVDYKRTLFISFTTDGREIVTMDDFGIEDLSGIRAIEVVYRADFEELVARHAQRLAQSGDEFRPFSESRLMDQYEDLGRVRAEQMMRLGYVKFLDIQESSWRYTPKGAFVNAYRSFIKGTEKARLQKDRARKKRPGS
jgi:hypothetical protein